MRPQGASPIDPATLAALNAAMDAEDAAENGAGPGQSFIPGCRYARPVIGVGLSTPQCGYAGAETTCDGSFERCSALGNARRFGGFRFAPAPGSEIGVGNGPPLTVGSRFPEETAL